MPPIVIQVEFDEEARVWVAQSDDLPLATEAETYEVLYRKLPELIQDVLEANGDPRSGTDIPFELITHSQAVPRVRVA